jgi:protein gp37
MIFVNSMSDPFHESVPDEWIDQIFAIMALTPQHTYQILTKRPERMKDYVTRLAFGSFDEAKRMGLEDDEERLIRLFGLENWPVKNVWLGVSIEDQATADERIPLLLETPAAVRWVSAEPLLGPVDLRALALPENWGKCDCTDFPTTVNAYDATVYCEGCCEGAESMDCGRIDWVVIGGESGRDARPMHPDWARSLRDQCADAEVPFFFKQWGEWAPQLGAIEIFEAGERSRYRWAEWREGRCDGNLKPLPDGWEFRDQPMWYEHDDMDDTQTLICVGKKTAGDRLDGIQHHNWPVKEAI